MLLLTAAFLSPVLMDAARAETVIRNKRETPISTSTAANGSRDDVRIDDDGQIELANGTAVTLDSANSVTNEGAIKIEDANDATGILARAGTTGAIKNSGTIQVDESTERSDRDKDDDDDGPFATGARRFGIRTEGAFTGNIENSGAITVEGNDSAALMLGGPLQGTLSVSGAVAVVGDNSYGIRTGDVSGAVSILGAVSASGRGSVGVATDGDIGSLVIQSAVTSTGYRYTSPSDDRDDLDEDDLLQGGAALRIGGNVRNGVLLDIRPSDNDDKDDDEDNDGKDDDEESSAAIASYGAAPAIEIGRAGRTVTLGTVGTGSDAYGLIIKGSVAGLGVYDGITGTAIAVGVEGGTTVIDGGVRIDGTVAASASKATATGMRVGRSSRVPEINIDGTLSATTETSGDASALVVAAGGSVSTLKVGGSVTAQADGDKSTAVAVADLSGGVSRVENTGIINARLFDLDDEQARTSGRAIALDLRANTTGVTINQRGIANDGDDGDDDKTDPDDDNDGVDNTDEPLIKGSILLGSGNDSVEILNGKVLGDISFGAGADTLVIEGAEVRGTLTDSDGRLGIQLRSGSLELLGTERVNGTSLTVGRGAQLTLTVDPLNSKVGGLNINGAAQFESGAKIGVRVTSLLRSTQTFELIRATSLTAGNIDRELLGEVPFIYASSLVANQNAGTLSLSLRRKTSDELGMNRSEASAYDAVYEALAVDDDVRSIILAQTDGESFRDSFDQMLPEHAGGVFDAVTTGSRASARAAIEGAIPLGQQGRRVWLQEVFYTLDRDRGATTGYRGYGFGLTGGIEHQRETDAFGASLSFLTGEIKDRLSATDTTHSANQFEAALFWRGEWGGLKADARLSGGWLSLSGKREFVGEVDDERIERTARSSGDGWLIGTRAGLGYDISIGKAYLRPGAAVEYFRLSESGRREKGGGDGFNLEIDKRTSDELSVSGLLAAGIRFDREDGQRLAIELEGGWRTVAAGKIGSTTARFKDGESFTLEPDPIKSAATGVLRIFGGGGGLLVGGEIGGEKKGDRTVISGRAIARLTF